MQKDDFSVYHGTDLGPNYKKNVTTIKVWAPTSDKMILRLYEQSTGGQAKETLEMTKENQGIWMAILQGDYKETYYTLQSIVGGRDMAEAVDPYAPAVGLNGLRGMIVDLESTNPPGWDQDVKPELTALNDSIIYELHVRDFSASLNSGIRHKGKFLGLTEEGTKSPEGEYTGLEHLKELGITHLHLLPVFDYSGVDEAEENPEEYNWGYNPRNYNALAGSYSTDPEKGHVRITEFKKVVMALHQAGIRIVMDVVYNHTGASDDSSLHQLVPGYYHRFTEEGYFSNGSGCGNEIASERPMVRKMIIDSVLYWAREFHIDGFRFDLMGLHDIETMNLIREEINKVDPSILLYGEGWTGGDSPLPFDKAAMKVNGPKLKGIALFSDDMRDAVKGHVFSQEAQGFVGGKKGFEEAVRFGIIASTLHPQVKYDKLQYSKTPWAHEPSQTINYVSCHDNHTLWDKLEISSPDETQEERIKMHKLANAIVLTSQGIPFLHGGVELCRTKSGIENSYNAPLEINQIDWARKTYYKDVFLYYQGLIALRKEHPAFRLRRVDEIQKNLVFLDTPHSLVVSYMLKNHAGGDRAKEILVFFNANKEKKKVYIPKGKWSIVVNDKEAGTEPLGIVKEGKYAIPGRSAYILIQE